MSPHGDPSASGFLGRLCNPEPSRLSMKGLPSPSYGAGARPQRSGPPSFHIGAPPWVPPHPSSAPFSIPSTVGIVLPPPHPNPIQPMPYDPNGVQYMNSLHFDRKPNTPLTRGGGFALSDPQPYDPPPHPPRSWTTVAPI